MKKNILAALVSLSCALGSTVANAEDLLQVFEIATANDPTVLKAKAQADAQSYQSDRAMSALLPQIGLTMGYTKSDSTSFRQSEDLSSINKINSESDEFSRGISLSQTLFDLGAWNSLGIADKQALQASGQYDFAKQNLIVRVAEGYFNVLSAIDNLEFVQAEKRAIERQLEQTKQRYAVGLTAITDVHEAQAQFDNSVAQEIIANNAVETAREQLREITGKYHAKLDMLNTKTFSTVKPSTPATDLVKIAKDKNLNLQVSKITVDIAKEQIELAKAGHYPKLTLNASYGDSLTDSESNGVSFDDQPRSDSSSIGLNFSVPLYSGGATVAATDQARAFYVAASQDFETDYRAVTRSVITSYNQVVSDIATFKALEQAVISAESALKATEAGFEVGTRTIVDVLISTQNLYNAKRNLADVRYRYVVSTLRLKQATGTLSREDLVGINQGLNTVN
ncbi:MULTISPECIES: outer membrane channel protein TolC [unclassified Pseudoalteromonas]|jgi:outer membrane protein|uniref:outer membrane channel protein TolC n=1 Tax=unclassified Pseudoalteromonas TaxID=194690 RepID=UPI00110AE77B|nr:MULTISPECIES: outer membrane channel protein TolC [unclassified Pseudoalteromonas]MDC2856114.1 outer membrane channel protein TolC [Ningiella sp. W23]NWL14364.1 outer membrane channel protein TolC [Pseudoalteromonas sp. Scap03]QLE82377.1 outer membrane channel protein TolC [Pseudoalteromonas sp. Scap25]QLE90319.1 outer membrane channel protein TolC [Pseudoalteromonas sp. Scap06]TMP68884.1 outer membrane channel protein TolC [Pseudoalteromonas sp. S1609]